MRIVSGKFKGRRITAPKKLPVRPTTDMAKEALFNILNNRFEFSKIEVLDLFAGSGNISYEFASRGSKKITAVDSNFECVKFIKKITSELEVNIIPIKSDAFKYLEKAAIKADVIFADPPYDMETNQFKKLAEICFERELLNKEGCLIIEHSKHTDISDALHFENSRKYGNSVFSFFVNSTHE